ncbi:hypothetical protein Hanom_Chr17g01591511 [Helianthus anomalus]
MLINNILINCVMVDGYHQLPLCTVPYPLHHLVIHLQHMTSILLNQQLPD